MLVNNGRTDVWLNGRKILDAEASRDYRLHLLTAEFKAALRNGGNVLAIHARKERPAQYVDLAILIN